MIETATTVVSKAPAHRRAIDQLAGWRDQRTMVYVYFVRNFETGAPTIASVRGVIAALDETAIEIKFADGDLRSVISDGEFFIGPIIYIDVRAERRDDADAVQIKLKGGDSVLIATRGINQEMMLSSTAAGFIELDK